MVHSATGVAGESDYGQIWIWFQHGSHTDFKNHCSLSQHAKKSCGLLCKGLTAEEERELVILERRIKMKMAIDT